MRINISLLGNFIFILICIFFSYQLLFTSDQWIFLDNVNLLIHEAGHLIFIPFGMFIHMLAGSMFQIFFPVCFLIYFLKKKDYFATSFIIFWIADNIINVSRYMKDAQIMALPLLGGDNSIHDWNWIFSNLGLLSQTQFIASLVYLIGIITLGIGITGMIIFTVTKIRYFKDEINLH